MLIPDLLLFGGFGGFREERELRQAERLLNEICAEAEFDACMARKSTHHDRRLRADGPMKRSVDRSLPTFCIESDDARHLHGHDFSAFEPRALRMRRA